MKYSLLFFLFAFAISAWAKECEVYGISDSPQALDCSFGRSTVSLRCKNGQYLLNQSPVKMAYHLEVEEGPVPLVFKTVSSELTVLMMEKIEIIAELQIGATRQSGSCRPLL